MYYRLKEYLSRACNAGILFFGHIYKERPAHAVYVYLICTCVLLVKRTSMVCDIAGKGQYPPVFVGGKDPPVLV